MAARSQPARCRAWPAETTAGYEWAWAHVMDGERVTDDHTVRFTVDPPTTSLKPTKPTTRWRIAQRAGLPHRDHARDDGCLQHALGPGLLLLGPGLAPTPDHSHELGLRQLDLPHLTHRRDRRVRIDEIVVTDPPINDRSSDGGWFVDADYRIVSAWYDPVSDIDWALVHELSHQVGVIDLYQLDMSVTSVQVLDRNEMPANFGFTWPRPDLMGGGDIAPHTDGHLYSSHGAAGFRPPRATAVATTANTNLISPPRTPCWCWTTGGTRPPMSRSASTSEMARWSGPAM